MKQELEAQYERKRGKHDYDREAMTASTNAAIATLGLPNLSRSVQPRRVQAADFLAEDESSDDDITLHQATTPTFQVIHLHHPISQLTTFPSRTNEVYDALSIPEFRVPRAPSRATPISFFSRTEHERSYQSTCLPKAPQQASTQ